ncbi:unnamed protein product, partial [Medioppia subpectinata]
MAYGFIMVRTIGPIIPDLFASFMIRSFMFIMKCWIDSRALPSYGPSPSNPL